MHGRAVAVVWLALGCAGCGSSAVVEGRSAGPPYDGPLTDAAAVKALECDGATPAKRFDGDYGGGLARVQSGAEAAFEDHVEAGGMGFQVPREGYRIERADERGALLSYDVRDRTKVAVVLRDGIRDWDGDRGWGVAAWAHCDPSELPAEVTDSLNVGVWEDAAGRRIPISRIRSFQGAEHCSWTHVTFLLVGPDERTADWYVRDPSGELAPFLRGELRRVRRPPAGVRDTGWQRDGRRLWLGPDAAYLVDLEDPGDVERWPKAMEPVWCS